MFYLLFMLFLYDACQGENNVFLCFFFIFFFIFFFLFVCFVFFSVVFHTFPTLSMVFCIVNFLLPIFVEDMFLFI